MQLSNSDGPRVECHVIIVELRWFLPRPRVNDVLAYVPHMIYLTKQLFIFIYFLEWKKSDSFEFLDDDDYYYYYSDPKHASLWNILRPFPRPPPRQTLFRRIFPVRRFFTNFPPILHYGFLYLGWALGSAWMILTNLYFHF